MVVFAFRNSTSMQAEHDIIHVMESIQATLAQLDTNVANIEPSWVAIDAETYYHIARKFRKHADEVASILAQVEAVLKSSRHAVTDYQKSIRDALNS